MRFEQEHTVYTTYLLNSYSNVNKGCSVLINLVQITVLILPFLSFVMNKSI